MQAARRFAGVCARETVRRAANALFVVVATAASFGLAVSAAPSASLGHEPETTAHLGFTTR